MNNKPPLKAFDLKLAVIGVILLIVSWFGSAGNRDLFYQGYLLGFIFVVGIPLGAAFVMLIHYLSHGSWGFAIRKVGLAATRTFPLVALMYLPIFMGIKSLYSWTNPEYVAGSHLLQQKAGYLNIPFFEVRTVLYFVVWILLSIYLEKRSKLLMHDVSNEGRTRMQLTGGLCMLAFVFTTTFAAFDWTMSLTPEWFSTIYGIFSIIGFSLLGLTYMIVMAMIKTPIEKEQDMHDLGNLTLALVMLWMYMAFSQFFIIWSGNLPEEIIWYLPRTKGGWLNIAWVLALFHFLVPFFLLINRTIKRSQKLLFKVALWMIIMRFVDQMWTVLPTFCEGLSDIHWVHILIPVGLLMIWHSSFVKKIEDVVNG